MAVPHSRYSYPHREDSGYLLSYSPIRYNPRWLPTRTTSRRTGHVRRGSISCRLHTVNTFSRCSTRSLSAPQHPHLTFVFRDTGRDGRTPTVQFLIPGFTLVGLSHVFGPTHRECANTAFDTLCNDGVRQRVVEVYLTFGEFPTRPHRFSDGPFSPSVSYSAREVVLVLLERVTGVQHIFVRERDRGDVLEFRGRSPQHRRLLGRQIRSRPYRRSEVPIRHRSDGTNVLHSVDFEINVRARLVLAEQEVRPVFFQVRAFRESDAVVLGVVFESVFFECHRGTRSVSPCLRKAGRIRLVKTCVASRTTTGKASKVLR